MEGSYILTEWIARQLAHPFILVNVGKIEIILKIRTVTNRTSIFESLGEYTIISPARIPIKLGDNPAIGSPSFQLIRFSAFLISSAYKSY